MSIHPAVAAEMRSAPDYPTMLKQARGDGVLIGIARGQVWCYRAVPLTPVKDIRNRAELHTAASPVLSALEGLASMSQNRMSNRSMSQGGYREFHMLLTDVPRLYRPAHHSPLYPMLTHNLGDRIVPKRQLLFGVRLNASTGITDTHNAKEILARAVSAITREPRLEDYSADLAKVSFILDRAGFKPPTSEEVAMADSWWNLGRHALTPYLPHPNHLHVFNSTKALQQAEQVGYGDCDQWTPSNVPGVLDLTLATVAEAELAGVKADTDHAHWIQDLISMGALAVSVRGKVEPMKVTRGEIRRQIKKWDSDEMERLKAQKRGRAEQQDLISETQALEGLYASKDAPSTIIDTSVIVALDGRIDNLDTLTANSAVRLSAMEARQGAALTEMMVCSPSRQNPRLHQWPTHVLAYSGIAGLTTAGDTDEPRALLGFTEHDRQPVGISPIATSRSDSQPITVVSGYTGSGKAQRLSTPIPTPTGWTTMGQLGVGDEVIGRDGQPCRVVHLSPVNHTPRLFRLTLSDGQQIVADGDHQWIASDFNDRHRGKRPNRVAAIERYLRQRAVADELDMVAERITPQQWSTADEIHRLVSAAADVVWATPETMREVLEFMDVPRREVVRDFTQVMPPSSASVKHRVEYPAAVAVRALAMRIRQRYAIEPSGAVDEQVVTTDEMIAGGVLREETQRANWSIRVAAPLQLPAADLPVDPYTLGAWLGDSISDHATLSGVDPEIWENIEAAGYTVTHFADGTSHTISGLKPQLIVAGLSLVPGNRHKKLDKRIPASYLRSSHEQRLTLLQGLMDTDGTVDVNGSCELSLSKPDLAADALELVRSLGIKASVSVAKASYVDTDGNHVPCSDRHRIRFTTNLPVFRLARKAERLPGSVRDTAAWLYVTSVEPVLPGDDDYEPARCIQVDSADSSYLSAGFVPTHNTLTLAWLASQWAEVPTSRGEMTPVVVINPKSNSDMTQMVTWVRNRTGQGQVYNLDNLLEADGVFDPIRFSRNREVGLELAMSAILSMNPFGGRLADYELPLTNALRVGIEAGANCIGEALEYAAGRGADPEMINKVLQLTDSIPKARAVIGRNPRGSSLSVAGGLTLIQVGETQLNIDGSGLAQRVDLTLLQMMVQGSAAALAHRDGVVMFDEAWVFAKGAGSALEALGRTAREMRVMMMLFNQRPSELLNAGMENYVSRSLVLALPEDEAKAACRIAGIEATPERIQRLGGDSGWGSMRAIFGENRKVLRGSVGIYVGLDERPVTVEITIPPAFFAIASTNAAEKGDRVL